MLTSIKNSLNSVMGRGSAASLAQLKKVLVQQELHSYNQKHYNEVFPGLFLGDVDGARDVYTLQKLHITHVLNAAYGVSFLYVNTDTRYYTERGFKCEFKGIPAQDVEMFDISVFFDETAEFIESALQQGGRVYVHCYQGVSRSATLVIVYLMIKQKMCALEALKLVSGRRAIYPNDGFLKQICKLETQLKRTSL